MRASGAESSSATSPATSDRFRSHRRDALQVVYTLDQLESDCMMHRYERESLPRYDFRLAARSRNSGTPLKRGRCGTAERFLQCTT